MLTVRKDPYKYRIKQTLISVYGGNSKAAVAELHKLLPKSTVNADITLRMSEVAPVPDTRLMVYACALGTTIEYLKADYIEFLFQTATT